MRIATLLAAVAASSSADQMHTSVTIHPPSGFGSGEDSIYLVAYVPLAKEHSWVDIQSQCLFSILQSSANGPFTAIFNPYTDVPRLTDEGDYLVLRHKVSRLEPGTQYKFKILADCEDNQETISSPASAPISTTLCGNGVVEVGEDCETGEECQACRYSAERLNTEDGSHMDSAWAGGYVVAEELISGGVGPAAVDLYAAAEQMSRALLRRRSDTATNKQKPGELQAPVAPVAANETFGSCNASSGSAASAGPLFAGNDQPVLMLAFSVVLISVFGLLLGHSMARRRWRNELNRQVRELVSQRESVKGRLRAMAERYNTATTRTQKMEAEIEQFKRTVRQLSEANTNASKRHKEELDQERKRYESEMDLMREKHVVEMGEHKEQRDRMMYDYEQQLEAQTAAYAQDREELGRLLQKAEAEKEAMQVQIEQQSDDMRQALEQVLRQKDQEISEHDKHRKTLEEHLAQVEADRDRRLAEARRELRASQDEAAEWEDRYHHIEADLENERTSAEARVAVLQHQIDQMRDEYQVEFDKIWHEYETKLQEGLDTKQREIDDLKKAISALEDEYGPALQLAQVETEQRVREECEGQYQDMIRSLQTDKDQLDARLHEAAEAHRRELESFTADQEAYIERITVERKADMEALKQQHEDAVDRLKHYYGEQLAKKERTIEELKMTIQMSGAQIKDGVAHTRQVVVESSAKKDVSRKPLTAMDVTSAGYGAQVTPGAHPSKQWTPATPAEVFFTPLHEAPMRGPMDTPGVPAPRAKLSFTESLGKRKADK